MADAVGDARLNMSIESLREPAIEVGIKAWLEFRIGPGISPSEEADVELLLYEVRGLGVEVAVEETPQLGISPGTELLLEPPLEVIVETIFEMGVGPCLEPRVYPGVKVTFNPILEPLVEPALNPCPASHSRPSPAEMEVRPDVR